MPESVNYNAVSLFTIPPDESLPFAVYVYYQGQYLPYRKPGQLFEVARYNRFIYKRISKLYIADADYDRYKEFIRQREAAETQKVDDPTLPIEQKVANKTIRQLDLATKALFRATDEEVGEAAAKVMEVATSTVQRVCERPYLRIYDSIPESSLVLSHSMRVSLLSTFLGYQLGFVNPIALEHLAIAGMLHDVGKTRVVLSDGLEHSDDDELELHKRHAELSVELLKKQPLVPEEVLTIIIEHHERRDGTGFPKGLRGRQIHGLSKVFQIANTFDNLVCTLPGDREKRNRTACQMMEKQMRNWFEPTILPKALKILIGSGSQT